MIKITSSVISQIREFEHDIEDSLYEENNDISASEVYFRTKKEMSNIFKPGILNSYYKY